MKKELSPCKVITGPNVRWSYVNVWEPRSFGDSKEKYSVSLIIPKSDTELLEKIRQAIQAAYKEGELTLRGKGNSVPPLEDLALPLRDGDVEHAGDPAYEGSMFLNASSGIAPGIVDANRQQITDHSQVYSGVYGRASISFFAYNFADTNGNVRKGIACGLNNLQKIRDGEPLSSRLSAEDDFADCDDDDDFLS